jgi:4-hydroxyacetophenone monooxygenase
VRTWHDSSRLLELLRDVGPNRNIATGGSLIFPAETWPRYIVEAIKAMIACRSSEIEVRPEALERYNRHLDERLAEMV